MLTAAQHQERYESTPHGAAAIARYRSQPEVRARYAARAAQRRADHQAYTGAIKQASGCIDCGAGEGLHFHHVDPATKLFTIADMACYSRERVDAEIAKCVVLCEPCHRQRHTR